MVKDNTITGQFDTTLNKDLENLNLSTVRYALKALRHDVQLKLLRLIGCRGQAGLTVTEMYTALRLEQSVASQHLRDLRRAKLVTTRREGKFIYYVLDEDQYTYVINAFKNICA